MTTSLNNMSLIEKTKTIYPSSKHQFNRSRANFMSLEINQNLRLIDSNLIRILYPLSKRHISNDKPCSDPSKQSPKI
jgi:hypothetical protein